MQKKIILFLSFFLIQSCSKTTKDGYYKGYETPTYKILNSAENIEIRQYESTLIAEVGVGGSRKEAVREGFLILAKYIFGKNVAKEKLAMTSPVGQEEVLEDRSEKIAMTSPVSQTEESNGKWLIQFTMPSKYKIEGLPKPENERTTLSSPRRQSKAALSRA